MATLTEQTSTLLEAVQKLEDTSNAAVQRVAADLAANTALIVELQAQVASGQVIDPTAFDSIIAGMTDATTKIAALDTTAVPPAA